MPGHKRRGVHDTATLQASSVIYIVAMPMQCIRPARSRSRGPDGSGEAALKANEISKVISPNTHPRPYISGIPHFWRNCCGLKLEETREADLAVLAVAAKREASPHEPARTFHLSFSLFSPFLEGVPAALLPPYRARALSRSALLFNLIYKILFQR